MRVHRYPVGSTMGHGFVVMSSVGNGRKIEVRCPRCRSRVWRRPDTLTVNGMKSCGCMQRTGISQTRRLERYRKTVEAARVAFATDTAYGIAMARAASRIQERRSEVSPTL